MLSVRTDSQRNGVYDNGGYRTGRQDKTGIPERKLSFPSRFLTGPWGVKRTGAFFQRAPVLKFQRNS